MFLPNAEGFWLTGKLFVEWRKIITTWQSVLPMTIFTPNDKELCRMLKWSPACFALPTVKQWWRSPVVCSEWRLFKLMPKWLWRLAIEQRKKVYYWSCYFLTGTVRGEAIPLSFSAVLAGAGWSSDWAVSGRDLSLRNGSAGCYGTVMDARPDGGYITSSILDIDGPER